MKRNRKRRIKMKMQRTNISKENEMKRRREKEKKNRNWGRGKAKELGKLGWNRFLFPFLLFLFFETFSLFSSSSFFSSSSSYLSLHQCDDFLNFPVISWERCSPRPHFIHPCFEVRIVTICSKHKLTLANNCDLNTPRIKSPRCRYLQNQIYKVKIPAERKSSR